MANQRDLLNNSDPENYLYHRRLKRGEIRLVRLEPDSDDSKIRCSFVNKSLNDTKSTYDALSYVWGDQSTRVTILCDEKYFNITRDLHEALLQLRRSAHDRLLWVDAICIDQSNEEEKTAQVRQMRTIYSEAEMVIIWLGNKLPTDRSGCELMQKMQTAMGRPKIEFDNDSATQTFDLHALGLPDMHDPAWDGAVKILSRPWFTRVWIVQEFLVARQSICLCGNLKFNPSLVIEFAANVAKVSTARNIPSQRAYAIFHCLERSRGNARTLFSLGEYEHRRLWKLLWSTRTFEATDPRDKVFALVALTDDIPNEFIDYRRSLRQVLTDVAIFALTRPSVRLPRVPDLLSYAEARTQPCDLPSWVPDWQDHGHETYPLSSISLHIVNHGFQYFFVDSNEVLPSFSFSSSLSHAYYLSKESQTDSTLVDANTFGYTQGLNVPGKFIDRIKIIVQSTPYLLPLANTPQVNDAYAITEQVHNWDMEVSRIIRSLASSGSYENPEEAHWRTLCFDGGPFYEPASPELREAFKAWRQQIQLVHQSHRSWHFSSTLALLRAASLFLLNTAFLSYGIWFLLTRQVSFYAAFQWLLSWPFAQWLLCTTINRTALFLNSNAVIDIHKFQSQQLLLASRYQPFEQLFGKFTAGRRFCLTERGFMGWVSLAAEEGDEIVALAGTNILFSLRGPGQKTGFCLKGDCYLQGLMTGEPYTMEGVEEGWIRII